MLTIGRLRIQLPHGYEHRAAAIVRHVADELARRQVSGDAKYSTLSVAPLQIADGLSDHQIGARIAGQIHRKVTAAS